MKHHVHPQARLGTGSGGAAAVLGVETVVIVPPLTGVPPVEEVVHGVGVALEEL